MHGNLGEPFRVEPIGDGFSLRFYDRSNRYYGDYHRIRVVVRMEIPVRREFFLDERDPDRACDRARRWLGDVVCFEKSLERMGVPGSQVASVRDELVASFLATAAGYMNKPDFPGKFVRKSVQERQKGPRPVA
ncbi:hypothetical protein EDC39_102236 [Geothermobacter ehrlichii]|uniref:Uncharacterized protein n=1 Tax=Geothermobacter ehrlichii TaxID=213224 RepID=A0A5D3WQF2_9BACT|nr:hypothetical protein [Geothermobacter ehrlichii]TYO99710.1 hypothetical protein EDC39_102236 [Geothermobacter ehrlichii]